MKKALFRTIYNFFRPRLRLHPDVDSLILGGYRLTNPSNALVPAENITFASRVIASGMWNYCFFQFYRHFAGPYWVERQYNPEDPSFIPRANSMLSLNLTHRTWLGFRSARGRYFSLLDPAGAISPVVGYYSLEFAEKTGNRLRLPARGEWKTEHRLPRGVPVPRVRYRSSHLELRVRMSGAAQDLVLISLRAKAQSDTECLIALRPFHPEGATLLHSLSAEERENGLEVSVNGKREIFFPEKPDRIAFSNLDHGDSYFQTASKKGIECAYGVATAVFGLSLKAGEERNFVFATRTYERDETQKKEKKPLPIHWPSKEQILSSIQSEKEQWDSAISAGAQFVTARKLFNDAARIYQGFLLSLARGPEITPGCFTYRQFFFRDAAYMLSALQHWNHLEPARAVLNSYPERQSRRGFFKSQEGEWDSNGQALYSLVEHARLSGDAEFLARNFTAISAGVDWILKTRKGGPEKKILPSGFSAEHLGPADHYYWDNLWSIAGLKAATAAARILGKQAEARRWRKEWKLYVRHIQEVSRKDRQLLGLLTAAPGRPIDSGMIGSIAMMYPHRLKIFPRREVRKTVMTIYERFFHRGLFFHPIIHSGYNIYLSLQVAQCLFELGEVGRARRILSRALKLRSPMWTFPEAIHPLSGGGVMGDGFHGWAYAEVLLLLRQLTFFQRKNTFIFFKGLRTRELRGADLQFGPFPFAGGTVRLSGRLGRRKGELRIQIKGKIPARYRIHLNGLRQAMPVFSVSHGQVRFRDGILTIEEPSGDLLLRYQAMHLSGL